VSFIENKQNKNVINWRTFEDNVVQMMNSES